MISSKTLMQSWIGNHANKVRANKRLNPTERAEYNLMPSHENCIIHSHPRGLLPSSEVVGGLAAVR